MRLYNDRSIMFHPLKQNLQNVHMANKSRLKNTIHKQFFGTTLQKNFLLIFDLGVPLIFTHHDILNCAENLQRF